MKYSGLPATVAVADLTPELRGKLATLGIALTGSKLRLDEIGRAFLHQHHRLVPPGYLGRPAAPPLPHWCWHGMQEALLVRRFFPDPAAMAAVLDAVAAGVVAAHDQGPPAARRIEHAGAVFQITTGDGSPRAPYRITMAGTAVAPPAPNPEEPGNAG